MFRELFAALFGGSTPTHEMLTCYETHLERQTEMIELFSVIGAVLLVAALVFIIIREKRKNRERS